MGRVCSKVWKSCNLVMKPPKWVQRGFVVAKFRVLGKLHACVSDCACVCCSEHVMARLESAWAFWFRILREEAGLRDFAQYQAVEFSLRCDLGETALWIAKNEFDTVAQLRAADDPSVWPGADKLTELEFARVRRVMATRERSRSRWALACHALCVVLNLNCGRGRGVTVEAVPKQQVTQLALGLETAERSSIEGVCVNRCVVHCRALRFCCQAERRARL